ncbi:MAG: hypothetical protein IKX59_07555 [Bacteroidales bacterium]|nr:hypothetical protein [Bacteroidales bacterium]
MSYSSTHIKTCLLLAGSFAFVSSCQDYEPFTEPEIKNVTYNREFEKTFGPVDPNHDWSMATRVTANIDLSHAPEGTYEVKIFSEKNGYLLTKAIVENSATLTFDGIKGESNVRILARKTSALGLSVINSYFPIVDGEVNTASGTRAQSTAEQCNTTVGDPIDLGTKQKSISTFEYYANNADVTAGGSSLVSELPTNDNVYYITKVDGETYADGDNGTYSVTLNGETSEYDMYTIADIIEDASKSHRYYEPTDAVYEYKPAGTISGYTATELPTTDNIYYIQDIADQSYGNGDNGQYKVTFNGEVSYKNMYEIAEIITPDPSAPYQYGDFRYILETTDGYTIPYGNYIAPAYYNKTQDAGISLAPDYTHPAYYHPATETITAQYAGNFYHLNDVYKSIDRETQVKFDDLLPLVSSSHPSPYFHEQVDNRTLYEDVLDYDIEYVLTEDGPITYTYVFYGSIYHNWLGYFYWHEDDNMTEEQIKQAKLDAPRYVFMEDTYPTTVNEETGKPILQCYADQDGTDAHTPEGMQMPVWVDTGIEQHTGHYLQGTTYHLVYFGENYDEAAVYEFPEGLHVAFFLITKYNGSNAELLGNGLFYSIQDMNNDQEIFQDGEGNNYFLNDKHWWAAENSSGEYDPTQERPDQGEVAAVTYSYKGNIVIGFEDDNDKDENDMLFLISAPIIPPVSLTEEEENSWIVACEDLGGTYDYDFNDLVFELTKDEITTTTTDPTTGEVIEQNTTIEWSIRALAAGGTLPATIYYDNDAIGEIHGMLGASTTGTPINVTSSSTPSIGTLEKLENVDEEDQDDISKILQHIKIVVENKNDNLQATEIVAPNKDATSNIPQMLLLPKGWDWPSEETCIYNVYPLFEQWAQDMTENGWIEDPTTNNINTNYFIVNPSK